MPTTKSQIKIVKKLFPLQKLHFHDKAAHFPPHTSGYFSSIGNSSFPYYPSLIGSSQPGVRGHPAVRSSFPRSMWVGIDGWMDGWTVRRFPISHPKLDTVLVPNWIGLGMKTKHMSSLEGFFLSSKLCKKYLFINTP
jgi:hypothetical protein